MPLDTNLFVIGYAPLPQTTDGEDEEPSLLPELRWGGLAHQDVLQKNHDFMKACNAHAGALPSDEAQQEEEGCFDCDEEQLGADQCSNDTSSAAYMEAQRQMLYAQEHAAHCPEVPQLQDMLHTDVDRADDSMHHHEAVRCVLDLVWQVEAPSQHKRGV